MQTHFATAIAAGQARQKIRHMTLATAAAAICLAALPALGQESDAVVEMTGDLNFQPPSLTIAAGDAVEWRNVSDVPHTVTADPEKAADPSHVALPEGAETFNSGFIQANGSFIRTFEVPGEYRYFCIPHEGAGMVGTLIVE